MSENKRYLVEVPPQARAMLQELVRIGVHGPTAVDVLQTLVLDQLKHLCGNPGFGPDLLRVANEAVRRQEAAARETEAKPYDPADIYTLSRTRSGTPMADDAGL